MGGNHVDSQASSGLPLEALSHTISNNASIVSQYLNKNGLPQPSFESDGPVEIVPPTSPQQVQEAREKLMAASLEMLNLAIGPKDFLANLAIGYQNVSCLTWLIEYDIFHLVPVSGEISYTDLSKATGVPMQRLKSILRMAMTNFIFRESPDGMRIKHTAASAYLAQSRTGHAYAAFMCRHSAPSALHMTAAHKKWGANSTRKNEAAYNAAFSTDLSFFEHMSQDKARTSEFAEYMNSVRTSDGLDIRHLVTGYKWKAVHDGALVVDVGGSTGGPAIAIATPNPHLKFIVQDLPDNADEGRRLAASSLAPDVASRITFQGYDFLQPQPVKGADIYLLRTILHDWPDADAVSILRNVAAAMDENKSRMLIMDAVLPESGSVPVSEERIQRSRDFTMMQTFNSKERHLKDWQELFASADSRLKVQAIHHPFGSNMSIMEVTLA